MPCFGVFEREVYNVRHQEENMRLAPIAASFLVALAGSAYAADDPWPDLVTNVFDDRPIEEGAGVISLETPYRAEDAAIVPITIRSELPADSPLRIEKITLVIDNNPAPVAAEFTLGDTRLVTEIEMRVRVDAYTNIHAVAELSDGKLYSVANFVKAAGGCAAPGGTATTVAGIGEMRLRGFENAEAEAAGLVDAQLMIRHPNNSGLQRDLITNYYIPAYFVRELEMNVGGDLLMRMEGGISISENPTFRVTYEGTGEEEVAVKAVDTEDDVFEQTFPGPLGTES